MKNALRHVRLLPQLVLTIWFGWGHTIWACPTCKEGLGNSSHLINGYGWSIVFMMSMPFLILAGVGGYFYYEVCKARAAALLVADERATAGTS